MTTMDENGNIHHIAGDTFDLHLVNIKEDDVAINWTGWKHELKVFTAAGKTTLFTFTETSGIDTSIPGTLRFKKLPNEITQTAGQQLYYDWIVTRPDDTVETWFNNKLFFVQ